MKRVLSLAIVAFCILSSSIAQTVNKLTANKISEYGLIYRLPTTVVDITVEAERTLTCPGEFHQYAVKYFGNNEQVITKPEESWTVKSVTISTHGEPVDTLSYLAQFKSGSPVTMIVNSQMVPLAINTDNAASPKKVILPEAREAEPTPLQSEAARQVMSEEMIQCQSIAKRAEIAAGILFSLRQSRTDIISGQAENMPPDGQALQLVLDRIDAQERALTAMFLGTTQHSTQVRTFSFVPNPDDAGEFVIARLSATEGIVNPDNLSGDPISLSCEVVERGTLPKNEKGETKRFPKGGVAYRIPGKAKINVEYDGHQYASLTFDTAQFGVVFGIDPAIFSDKKAPSFAIFNPVTGGISQIGIISADQ